MDCRKGPETKIFHPGLVNLSSNFHKMAAFNWLPDFRSNAPSSFTYDLYGDRFIDFVLQSRTQALCSSPSANVQDIRYKFRAFLNPIQIIQMSNLRY